jgi:stress response protein YsnF
MDGPAISEEEHEVVLHAEQPVVAKEAVPVERVRLDTETVTEQVQVNEELRKEEIEVDGVRDTTIADNDRRI